ncbi:MAG: hypothetical protein AMS25_07655 [Gemmatimonas sp. SM23_52]|nr:MAG: hypothetical protein AMS25_07655 [Gemmatimonas sp. SM23_52]
MSDESFGATKQEIRFFMGKAFEVSVGYIGALVAVAAAAKLGVVEPLALSLHAEGITFLSASVMFLNFTYLTVATACTFATLKRGYYILLYDTTKAREGTDSPRQWEVFLRNPDHPLFKWSLLNKVAWETENYYMLPLFVLIAVTSSAAFVIGWQADNDLSAHLTLSIMVVLHIVPIGGLFATVVLGARCRQNATAHKQQSALPDQGEASGDVDAC